MRVDLHAVCWNEARLLPYFFRHYEDLVDRFFIYDDDSTDGSVEVLEQHPAVEIRPVPKYSTDSLVESLRLLQDHCWKVSRGHADWVIVVAVDEHLYHESMRAYLERCKREGITAIPAVGFQMISDEFPRQERRLSEIVRHGVAWKQMNKLALFDPEAIRRTNFAPGRHLAEPEGRVVYPAADELRLLHYKYLGLDYLTTRLAELRAGLRAEDIRKRWGHRWLWAREEAAEDFLRIRQLAELVVAPGPMPRLAGEGDLWWRE